MKKIINIFIALFIIACPTITRAATDCNSVSELVSKFCQGVSGGMGGNCCTDTRISFSCNAFKPNIKTADVKTAVKAHCPKAQTVDVQLFIPGLQGTGKFIDITSEYTTQSDGSQWATTQKISITGTVIDAATNSPLDYATVAAVGTQKGTTTDNNGNFSLKDIDSNATINFRYEGYKEQNIKASELKNNPTIKLEGTSKELDEVAKTVELNGTPCSQPILDALNAQSGNWKKENDNLFCDITCKTNYTRTEFNKEIEYTVNDKEQKSKQRYKCECTGNFAIIKDNVCTELTDCSTDPNATHSAYEKQSDGTYKCFISECKKGYQPNETQNATSCIQELKKCKDEDVKKHPNAKKTGIKEGTINTCIATECNCGYTLDETKGKCIQWTDKDESGNPISKCDAMPDNAKSAHLTCIDGKSVCKITECISTDFDLDDQKNKCINKNKKPCTSDDKNATDAEYRTIDGKMVCFITDCKKTHTPSKDGTKCNPVPRLSEEDSQKKVDELKENAKKMKEKEQSTENKLLGAAGIGATGIGAMNLMSAAAEQSADEKAEAAMKAYLATFHCNYGAGKNIPGGETEVQLPGGNELVSLYAEYVNLANDLKVRKAALDMRPGIESESILDSATSGLYDDIAIGKTSGAFTSLARALSDPNSADAAAWAQQKADTASKLKTGAITAGIGAVGSLVGNLVINSGDDKKNKMYDIIDKFDKKKRIFEDTEQEIQKLEPQGDKKCPSGATGTYPNCDCGNKIYNSNANTCDACEGDKTVQTVDGVKVCKCPTDKPVEQGNRCVAKTADCMLTSLAKADKCECIENASAGNDNVCKCNDDFEETDRTCTKKSAPKVDEKKQEEKKEETKTITLTMPADSLFLIGKSELSSDAKTILANFRKKMEDEKITNCTITVTGHTDRTGKTAFNKTLSEKRAQAVWDELKDSTAFNATASVVEGKGLTECTCGTGPIPSGKENDIDYRACKDKENTHTVANMRYAPCRRVVITLDSDSCTTPANTTLSTALGTVAGVIAGAGTGTK